MKIMVPTWMEEERLIRAHKHEQDHKDFAPDVPFYYYEVFEAFSNLAGILKEEGKVRELINAIHNSRMRKVEEQLKEPEQACFKNIGSIELEKIRDVWQEVCHHLHLHISLIKDCLKLSYSPQKQQYVDICCHTSRHKGYVNIGSSA